MSYAVVIWREDLGDGTKVYVARHPELPGCTAQGDTIEEVRAGLDECRELWLEGHREAGLPDPEPFVIRESGTVNFFADERPS